MSLSTNEKPMYARTINNGVGVISASANTVTLGSDTNGATILTAGADGARVESLVISTDDTVAVNVFIYILSGATVRPLGIVNVPLSSGNTGSAPLVDALDNTGIKLLGMLIDPAGKRYISLAANEVLKCGALANLTAAKKAHVTAQGFNY